MEKRLLDAGGQLLPWHPTTNETLVIAGDTAPNELVAISPDVAIVIVNFSSSADGRGFSLAQHLRRRLQYTGKLLASGNLIPDQVTQVFANNFDGVLLDQEQIDRYGSRHWTLALTPVVKSLYWRSSNLQDVDIWAHRKIAG